MQTIITVEKVEALCAAARQVHEELEEQEKKLPKQEEEAKKKAEEEARIEWEHQFPLGVIPPYRPAFLSDHRSWEHTKPGHYDERWINSVVSPMKLLAAFPSLRIKPGFELRAYLYRVGGNGNGFVFAVPEGTPQRGPDEFLTEESGLGQPPKPPEALADFSEAIEGDGSPESYFEASLFTREAHEFGALWHGSSWSSNNMLTSNPCEKKGCPRGLDWRELAAGRVDKTLRGLHDKVPTELEQWNALKAEAREKAASRKDGDEEPRFVRFPLRKYEIPDLWTWRMDIPEIWQPTVSFSDEQVAVSFYTYSGLGVRAIYQWIDTYQSGICQFSCQQEWLGLSGGGYVY